jgi:hypothetical protein
VTHARVSTAPTRERLRDHLVAARITGDVATPRQDNLAKYRMFADREPGAMFGLDPKGRWDPADVLELMSLVVGVSPDPQHVAGADRIDPDRTLAGLDRLADHVGRAARPAARVLFATGHPAGLLPVHLRLAAAVRGAGAEVLTPASGAGHTAHSSNGPLRLEIRYVCDVAVVSNRGDLNHTHSPVPMEQILEALERAGEAPPDLVVGDHGWAGAAGRAGVTAVGFADSNDPALFVGEAEGTVAVSVPLDDNVAPHLYEPMTAYLLAAAGLDRR